ncbi:hypothetical protein CCUS01_04621 [Colletotrichum cuscutae]|uniref:Uncharacterized protein n=1 Tax=Colletotrichum cuscutae TaxID=1209917 RepID=A0AAI9VFM5_9PEZI|nr:hypothetical protein CCUS01_04621 [Colletotrichum cuscutae]
MYSTGHNDEGRVTGMMGKLIVAIPIAMVFLVKTPEKVFGPSTNVQQCQQFPQVDWPSLLNYLHRSKCTRVPESKREFLRPSAENLGPWPCCNSRDICPYGTVVLLLAASQFCYFLVCFTLFSATRIMPLDGQHNVHTLLHDTRKGRGRLSAYVGDLVIEDLYIRGGVWMEGHGWCAFREAGI